MFENNLNHPLVEVAKFEGFGFWVESVSTINKIFSLMQPLINALTDNGYRVIEVSSSGGVHELDTGYECFSNKKYSSFEIAKDKMPLDFAKEENDKLDGSWLNTLNFENFSIRFAKDNACFMVILSRGELRASSILANLIPIDDMKATLTDNN